MKPRTIDPNAPKPIPRCDSALSFGGTAIRCAKELGHDGWHQGGHGIHGTMQWDDDYDFERMSGTESRTERLSSRCTCRSPRS